jgi:hypothetical protein
VVHVEHIQVTKPSMTESARDQTWRHAQEVVDCNLCCVAAQISGSIINGARFRSPSGTNVEMTYTDPPRTNPPRAGYVVITFGGPTCHQCIINPAETGCTHM